MAGDLPKVPYLAGEMVPTFVVPAKSVAINSASAQKGSGMPSIKTVLSWGAALALVAWVAAGMYYYYGKTPDPPLFWIFGSAQENRLEAALLKKQQLANNTVIGAQFNGLTSNGPIQAPIDRQPGPPPQISQRYQPSPNDRCDEEASFREVPSNASAFWWDEGICAYHYKL